MIGTIIDERVMHAVSLVIPAMWSPRFRVVAQLHNVSSQRQQMAQEM
jgi:hypothetical protein